MYRSALVTNDAASQPEERTAVDLCVVDGILVQQSKSKTLPFSMLTRWTNKTAAFITYTHSGKKWSVK